MLVAPSNWPTRPGDEACWLEAAFELGASPDSFCVLVVWLEVAGAGRALTVPSRRAGTFKPSPRPLSAARTLTCL